MQNVYYFYNVFSQLYEQPSTDDTDILTEAEINGKHTVCKYISS